MNRGTIILYILAFLSIPFGFVVRVFTEAFVGYKFATTIQNIDESLPLMPPDYYLTLILLLVGTILFAYQLWNERDYYKKENKEITKENNELNKRIDSLIDKRISQPVIHLSSSDFNEKLSYIKEKMETIVNNELYVHGIQLYKFVLTTKDVQIKRMVEYINDISSWESATMQIQGNIATKFRLAKSNMSKLSALVEEFVSDINKKGPEEINQSDCYKYAILNIASQILNEQGVRIHKRVNYRNELAMFNLNKRIGIMEAVLYIKATNDLNYYIFQKRHGDQGKRGRYYYNTLYYINDEPYILLITYDKEIEQLKKERETVNDFQKSDEILNPLAK